MSSVVASVASAAASVRSQRADGLHVIDKKGAEVSTWLQEMMNVSLCSDSFLFITIELVSNLLFVVCRRCIKLNWPKWEEQHHMQLKLSPIITTSS